MAAFGVLTGICALPRAIPDGPERYVPAEDPTVSIVTVRPGLQAFRAARLRGGKLVIADNEDLRSGKCIPICRGVMGSHGSCLAGASPASQYSRWLGFLHRASCSVATGRRYTHGNEWRRDSGCAGRPLQITAAGR